MVHNRLRTAGTQLTGTELPPLITELSGQYSGYSGVQPCFDTLLYQMQHINQTVIALPPAMQVCSHAFLCWTCLHGKACLTSVHTTFSGLA